MPQSLFHAPPSPGHALPACQHFSSCVPEAPLHLLPTLGSGAVSAVLGGASSSEHPHPRALLYPSVGSQDGPANDCIRSRRRNHPEWQKDCGMVPPQDRMVLTLERESNRELRGAECWLGRSISSPGQSCIFLHYKKSASTALQAPLREAVGPNGGTVMIKVPFSTTDLIEWKRVAKDYRSDPDLPSLHPNSWIDYGMQRLAAHRWIPDQRNTLNGGRKPKGLCGTEESFDVGPGLGTPKLGRNCERLAWMLVSSCSRNIEYARSPKIYPGPENDWKLKVDTGFLQIDS
ncbi:uncharacterized protein AAGF69_014800 isoform 2-T2 [Amazona ochrocephala]